MSQAKTLTEAQIKLAITAANAGYWAKRNVVMVLLSFRAGLRASDMQALTWAMVTDSCGLIADLIHLPASETKGSTDRDIPVHPWLKDALRELYAHTEDCGPQHHVIQSHRDCNQGMPAKSIVWWFKDLYRRLKFEGATSHSGRRTFLTRAAREISKHGGSLRDVQRLAGHSSLETTQRYIDESAAAKRRLIEAM